MPLPTLADALDGNSSPRPPVLRPVSESFEEFKNSFSYGHRSDLAFKFLKRLSAEEAGEFLRELLERLGETIDDGGADRLIELAREYQVRAYTGPEGEHSPTYPQAPFARLRRPLAESRLGLISSSGHFVEGHDPQPFGVASMTQEEATHRILDFLREAPQLSEIPIGTASDRLRVRHGGYDVRAAQKDPNVVFPIDRLRELRSAGRIGELPELLYSFVGAAAQTRLLKETGPQWVERFKQDQLDAVLLVPA